ncbi:MAG TPA: glutathione S-transferase family protein [Caulobacteraceae bacterium]|nr:glutathione S-transferase family protein [Caulobacteraceae bacterium]
MQLYSANLSPYASRARLAIYAKGLPVEIQYPPGGMKSPEYLGLNPMGKVPCLHIGDGHTIPESSTILEYLEDAFPETPLRPKAPGEAARVRLIARVCEMYVMDPLHHLFDQMNPETRDVTRMNALLDELDKGLGHLEHYLSGDAYAAGGDFTLADCEIVPVLFYVKAMGPAFGRGDMIAKHPKLSAYMTSVANHSAVAKVNGELGAALQTFMSGGGVT